MTGGISGFGPGTSGYQAPPIITSGSTQDLVNSINFQMGTVAGTIPAAQGLLEQNKTRQQFIASLGPAAAGIDPKMLDKQVYDLQTTGQLDSPEELAQFRTYLDAMRAQQGTAGTPANGAQPATTQGVSAQGGGTQPAGIQASGNPANPASGGANGLQQIIAQTEPDNPLMPLLMTLASLAGTGGTQTDAAKQDLFAGTGPVKLAQDDVEKIDFKKLLAQAKDPDQAKSIFDRFDLSGLRNEDRDRLAVKFALAVDDGLADRLGVEHDALNDGEFSSSDFDAIQQVADQVGLDELKDPLTTLRDFKGPLVDAVGGQVTILAGNMYRGDLSKLQDKLKGDQSLQQIVDPYLVFGLNI